MKYLVIAGGVISGIGKGILASSCGVLLKSMGYKVTVIKIDPYLNIDAGLMNPSEHGEVFVLDDGGEVDLDLGNYERSLDINLTSVNNITTGKIYKKVIDDERKGRYLGKTVQVVPHITNEIQDWIVRAANTSIGEKDNNNDGDTADICIIELGGTIGDIESQPFVEAIRQFKRKLSPDDFCLIQVSLVPGKVEQKSKPTQATVKDLRSLGLIPDIIACRCTSVLQKEVRDKISLHCDVDIDNILSFHDCDTIYEVPILLKSQGVDNIFAKKFGLNYTGLTDYYVRWQNMTNAFSKMKDDTGVKVAIVGKYTKTSDSYFSITKALEHASATVGRKIIITWIESTDLEEDNTESFYKAYDTLKSADGILIPGGFGNRGVDGKMFAIKYARENMIPLFGICFGMQLSVIEFARNVLGMKNANSEELDQNSDDHVVILMPEIDNKLMGGTQRLGARDTIIVDELSKVKKIYDGATVITERHRHRYEVNPAYIKLMELNGLKFVGKDTTNERMEIIELDEHPFFVASQFHPEYLSRPLRPAPLFVAFVRAMVENQ